MPGFQDARIPGGPGRRDSYWDKAGNELRYIENVGVELARPNVTRLLKNVVVELHLPAPAGEDNGG